MTQVIAAVAGLSREWVDAFSRQRGEPDWLREARLAAWERYEALPMPTTRDEGWRRTDVSGLDIDRLALPRGLSGPADTGDSERRSAPGGAEEQAGLLVLRNGVPEQQVLDEKLASRGVLLMSLADAVKSSPELVREHLSRQQPSPSESKFDALRAALWADGVLVYVPRNVIVEMPLQVVHWNDGPGAALAQTLVIADEGSSLALVESYTSPADRPESLGCAEVYVIAKPAAHVTCVQLQERDEQSWNVIRLGSEQERDSRLTWLLLGLGGRLTRTQLDCSLIGQGAEADLIGAVFGESKQHFDLESVQDHLGSDTRSDLLLRVALRDQASSNFTGMIRVGKNALRTSSNQVNRNLLLSDSARADSDPKLEILNSDVTRCGHGATVGPVDREQIFYLMTRGLAHDAAEALIVQGFFQPLLDQVPLENLRQRLWTAIQRKLEK